MSKNKDDLLTQIKKLAREEQLEKEKTHGRLRSKTWGGKPTSKEIRRKEKNELNKMVSQRNFEQGDLDA